MSYIFLNMLDSLSLIHLPVEDILSNKKNFYITKNRFYRNTKIFYADSIQMGFTVSGMLTNKELLERVKKL